MYLFVIYSLNNSTTSTAAFSSPSCVLYWLALLWNGFILYGSLMVQWMDYIVNFDNTETFHALSTPSGLNSSCYV